MKKILLSFSIAVLLLSTGCLKDKAYEDQQYGMANTEVKGITLPQSKNLAIGKVADDSISVKTDVNSTTSSQVISLLVVAAESILAPTEDIQITVALKPSLIPVTGGYASLPAGTYSVPTTVTIPAGKRNAVIPITFSNTSTYSLTSVYALALSITSATGGYQIAANRKDLVVTFNVKNKYDGNYKLSGYHNRVPYTFPYVDVPMDMKTSGASSVVFYFIEVGDLGHPIGDGPGSINWYGNTVAPEIIFDPVTNVVTNIRNTNAAGPPITLFTGAGSYPSRYDASTKTIYACWNYNGNPLRAFFDTLTYVGPRP
jgi:Domain of unknown function (DUF1735)